MLHPPIRRLAIPLIVLVGCADGVGTVDPDLVGPHTSAALDLTIDPVPGFRFLPPIAAATPLAGSFDAGLLPAVDVLCRSAGCGDPVHVRFGPDGDPGGEAVRVSPGDGHYHVNWNTARTGARAGETYRVQVRVDDVVLGAVDVALARNARESALARDAGLVPLVAGQTLPIRFRIEAGVVARVVVTPAEVVLAPGDTQPFTATLLDLHGREVAGAAVSWTSSDETVATVGPDGVATARADGEATITASHGALSGTASVVVETAGGAFLSPGDITTVATLDGWSVRCLAWNGRVCVHAQVSAACDACGLYGRCGDWHDVTVRNNGDHRTTRNFCAIATGSPQFGAVAGGAQAESPRACGWNAATHPICEPDRATFHVAGVGINPIMGLLLDDPYCAGSNARLTVECAAW